VCDDGWGWEESNVACKSLGYAGAQMYRHGSYYGRGTGEILLDDVVCTGREGAYCIVNMVAFTSTIVTILMMLE